MISVILVIILGNTIYIKQYEKIAVVVELCSEVSFSLAERSSLVIDDTKLCSSGKIYKS